MNTQCFRRLTSTVAQRRSMTTLDWSKPIFKSDTEMIAKINTFRAWVATADTMAEQYSAPPAPIDFSAVKEKVRAKDLVENLEKFYATAQPPAETYVWDSADKAEKNAIGGGSKSGSGKGCLGYGFLQGTPRSS
mmetsp:Transcript_29370/g.42026  ORF Transcript_29370/g.42026 Transcript_29370/m.42026 type:complete len:134 (-) Transcript_29370:387-788(-)